MGRGRVIAAHGEGRYTIEVVEDRARAESARAMAVQRVSQLDQQIARLEQDISAAQHAVDQAAIEQNGAIALYRQQLLDTGDSDVDLTAYATAVVEASASRDALRTQQGRLRATRLSLQARIQRIDALPALRQVEAWCADRTEDLAGEVATAEVPGETGQVIIKPGFHDAAAWSPSADGAIQPALSGTPASVFYNLAMMPGWQKWRPTFRVGTISNVDNDLCDVTLDAATSSQQGLNVNAQSHYGGVPIFYMDCNGDAFEDGDRVLVAFSGNTGQPMVVGFEREPKVCLDPNFGWSTLDYRGDTIRQEIRRVVLLPFRVTGTFEIRSVGHLPSGFTRQLSYIALYRCTPEGIPTELIHLGKNWHLHETYASWIWSRATQLPAPIEVSEGYYGILIAGAYDGAGSIQNLLSREGFNYSAFDEDKGTHVALLPQLYLRHQDLSQDHFDRDAPCLSDQFTIGYPTRQSLFNAVINHPAWQQYPAGRYIDVGINRGVIVEDWPGYPLCPLSPQ